MLDPLPTVTPRRMLAEGDLVIAEAHLDYGSGAYDCVFIFEMRDGLIAKETAYWATPYDPPDWRAALVERI
jgi:ketosteroid isomerase-like protein